MTLDELIARLERAEGPLSKDPAWDLADDIADALGLPGDDRMRSTLRSALGGSIDAALALVPEGRVYWGLHSYRSDVTDPDSERFVGEVSIHRDHRTTNLDARHRSPAVALCIAAIRARKETPNG